MFGLSTLGAVHTALSLVAVFAGFAMTLRFGRIATDLRLGRTYLICTALTCLTGFGIFRHGNFNIAHALGVLTLIVLAVAAIAGRWRASSRAATYVETLGYSATLFFHMIPGFTETLTRLPLAAPLAAGPEDPLLQNLIGLALLAFLVGAGFQIRQIWKRPMPTGAAWPSEGATS